MRDINRENIISKINRGLHLNSNNLDYSQCYYLCADKRKLLELLKEENQIIFGRRGTGKTTIFKAFNYYINNIFDVPEMHVACWYSRLDEYIPCDVELKENYNTNEVIAYAVKKYLTKFHEFLLEEYYKIENRTLASSGYYPDGRYTNDRCERIIELLGNLEVLIDQGTKQNDSIAGSEITHKVSKSSKEGGFAFTPAPVKSLAGVIKWVKIKFGMGKESIKSLEHSHEKKYVYRIDIGELKKRIDEIVEEMFFDKIYICIDEFTQIDKDFTCTIQPQVAQILKQLFFNSNVFVVKIASVWNETRMQNRQLNGQRMGIELGQDIFTNKELNLDTMFSYDNNSAYSFFEEMLANQYLLHNDIHLDEKQTAALRKYIIDELFCKNSFRHLVCGSQGIPRVFGVMLSECIKKMGNRKTDKISVSEVLDSIISNYKTEVRRNIPYSHPIYEAIDDYVTTNRRRFFLISIKDHNKVFNFFDGLVANNALHQCPSEQLPRIIRNKYEMFYVHYGNYLESLREKNIKQLNSDSVVNNGHLFPAIPTDLCNDTDRYILKLPPEAFNTFFCMHCQKEFEKSSVEGNKLNNTCPSCGHVVSVWF